MIRTMSLEMTEHTVACSSILILDGRVDPVPMRRSKIRMRGGGLLSAVTERRHRPTVQGQRYRRRRSRAVLRISIMERAWLVLAVCAQLPGGPSFVALASASDAGLMCWFCFSYSSPQFHIRKDAIGVFDLRPAATTAKAKPTARCHTS